MERSTDTMENLMAYHPFLKGISPAFLHILNEAAMFATVDARQTIINEGADADYFYLIHSGSVVLEAYLPGKGTVTVQILGAGETLGCSWLYPPYRWRFTARPLEKTEFTALNARILRERISQNREFGYELAMRIGQVVLQRLQATRALLVDFHGVTE